VQEVAHPSVDSRRTSEDGPEITQRNRGATQLRRTPLLEDLIGAIRNMNWTQSLRAFIVCGLGRGLSIERTGARRGRLTFPGQPLLQGSRGCGGIGVCCSRSSPGTTATDLPTL
jgi:hypothetical protein